MRNPLKIDVHLPAGKCGAGEPLDCSVPWIANIDLPLWVLSEKNNRALFNSACIKHDYCYRHGFLTYKKTKDECDKEFLANMSDKCMQPLATVITAGLTAVVCHEVAVEMYGAVHMFGGGDFRKENGSICYYEGNGNHSSGSIGKSGTRIQQR